MFFENVKLEIPSLLTNASYILSDLLWAKTICETSKMTADKIVVIVFMLKLIKFCFSEV